MARELPASTRPSLQLDRSQLWRYVRVATRDFALHTGGAPRGIRASSQGSGRSRHAVLALGCLGSPSPTLALSAATVGDARAGNRARSSKIDAGLEDEVETVDYTLRTACSP